MTELQSKSEKKEPLHPEEIVTTALLIRHGHTGATEQGICYTDPAAELTAAGQAQAELIGKWLETEQADVLLSSSSQRVVTTAQIVGRELSMPFQVVQDLNEWNVGEWEGRAYIDIKSEEPELYAAWVRDPIVQRPPGGESIEDVCRRASVKLDELMEVHKGKRIALVTHAGIIRAAIIKALQMDVRNFWRLVVPVGTITRIDFSPSFATLQFMSVKPK